MKNSIESYFDSAKKARNSQPLLSNDEILQQLTQANPSNQIPAWAWKMKALIGGSVLVAGSVIMLYYSSNHNNLPLLQQSTVQPTIQSVNSPENDNLPVIQPDKPSIHSQVQQVREMQVVQPRTESNDLPIQSIANNQDKLNTSTPNTQQTSLQTKPQLRNNTKDIEGLTRLELTEREAIILATRYPKLHVWLQRKFSSTDTCDITLAPSEKDKADKSIHHSALLLKINIEHSEPLEFLLWFTPNKEFTNALPERHREQLENELHALAEVETRCIPAEQACKAVKNESPFFDLCRRESGALFGVSIAPNPARENAECTFTLKESRDINISLHDLNGRFVRTMIFNELKPSGENKVPLMLEGIPAGAYLLAIRTERGEQAIQQLVVGQ